jgi:hypothetical protein
MYNKIMKFDFFLQKVVEKVVKRLSKIVKKLSKVVKKLL